MSLKVHLSLNLSNAHTHAHTLTSLVSDLDSDCANRPSQTALILLSRSPTLCSNQATMAHSAWRCHPRNGPDTLTVPSETNVILSWVLTWWQSHCFYKLQFHLCQMIYFFLCQKCPNSCLLTSPHIYPWKDQKTSFLDTRNLTFLLFTFHNSQDRPLAAPLMNSWRKHELSVY